MSLDLLKEMLEDADLFGFIREGAYATSYDDCAEDIFSHLSKDLSIEQINNIIWDVFYHRFCVCVVGGTGESFVLDKAQAATILGSPDRYKDLAFNIRHSIIGL